MKTILFNPEGLIRIKEFGVPLQVIINKVFSKSYSLEEMGIYLGCG